MGILSLFRKDKKSIIEKKSNEIISSTNITDVETEFLKKLNGYLVDSEYPKYWNDYIKNIDIFIKRAKEGNLLKISTPIDEIEYLKVKELKDLLDKKALDSKGKKDKLIERVIENYSDTELKDIIEWNERYILTKEGNKIVEEYTINNNKLYRDLSIEVFSLIKELNINEAYIKIAQFEQKQVFKRGMGIDWDKEAKSGISKKDIKSYEDMIKEESENINLVIVSIAGILLGVNSKKIAQMYSEYLDNYSNITDEINYIQSIIHSKKEMNDYIETGVNEYQILGTLDKNTCEKCGNLDGKVFSCKDKKIGANYPPFCKKCRCTTVPYFKDDSIRERAAKNPDTGKTFYVPSNMTYIDYKKVFIYKEISLQEWIKNNKK